MKLTAKQIRIFTDAAIDASPKMDDEEEDGWIEGSPSGHKSQSSKKKVDEEDRRRHRQLMRQRGIKPSRFLAERQRKGIDAPKSSIFSKASKPQNKPGAVNSIEEFVSSASRSREYSISDKAKRILKLGGYQ